jgi:hypothetical protein
MGTQVQARELAALRRASFTRGIPVETSPPGRWSMSAIEIIITSVLSSVGGGAVVLTALSSWLGKVWSDRIVRVENLLGQIDIDLRQRRIEVYKELWETTAMLPKWPRAEGIIYEDLLKFSRALQNWYFHRGGMYLSKTTHREGYTVLQEAIENILKANESGSISEEHYDLLREKCSSLRRHLASDIESRRDAPSQGTTRFGW